MANLLFALFVVVAGAIVWSAIEPKLNLNPQLTYKDSIELALKILAGLGTGFAIRQYWKRTRETPNTKPFRLSPSFDSGLLGGFIGGCAAGLFIGLAYYLQFNSSDPSITVTTISEIFAFSAIGGLVLGAAIQFLILAFRYLVAERQYVPRLFNDASGGALGGAMSGVLLGLSAVHFFGFKHQDFIGTVPLVIGTILCVIFVAAGALFYDYRGRWGNVARAFITSLLITVCTAMVGITVFDIVDIDKWVYVETRAAGFFGGAFLGIVIGGLAGLQVGLTFLFYRVWEITESP